MRRSVRVVVGACAVVALAGTALHATSTPTPVRAVAAHAASDAATAAGGRPGPTPPQQSEAAAGSASTAAGPVAGAPAGTGPAAAQDTTGRAAGSAAGRQRIGTVEAVTRALDYRSGTGTATFHRPGASYVKVHFSRLALLPGDHVTVADPSGAEVHRYGGDFLTEAASLVDGGRWAMSVTGDTAVVTLHRGLDPLGVRGGLERLGVRVDQVAYGVVPAGDDAAGAGEPTAPGRSGREESICGRNDAADAVCYESSHPVPYARSRAVARLLINGTELCTGWRIGPDNRMLTNNHCFANSRDAYHTEVWFGYRCARCGGYEVFPATKVWGDRVLATHRALDFTLFTLEDFDQVREYGYLEPDTGPVRRGDELYIPQHPGGEPLVIAMDSDRDVGGNCSVYHPAYRGYARGTDVAYHCDTRGGSSGSPVLSRATDKVIALHHFGGCPNSGVRMDLIHQRIHALL